MSRYRPLTYLLILALVSLLLPSAPLERRGLVSLAQDKGPAPSLAIPLDEIPVAVRAKIDPRLLRQLIEARQNAQLRSSQPAPVTCLVHLREQAPLQDVRQLGSALEQRALVVSRLQTTAERSQAPILAYLEGQVSQGKVTRYKSYWVFNGLSVDADLDTIVQLALRPDVESVRANNVHRLPAPAPQPSQPVAASSPPWGISRIGADRVWQSLGITGAGVVVANLDSGVDWLHPALQRKYRGYNALAPAASVHDYNWFDATGTYPSAPGPNRAHISAYADHGTHTMGSMVGSASDGSEPIGVAPDARWIAVKVFDDEGYATDEWIHAGFQWCLAPTDLRGQHPDPSKAPHIVSNSWGDSEGQSGTFRQDVTTLRAAGILSTFSAGNDGPEAGTIGAPASYQNAFAVGASDASDRVASFSSRGPSPWGQIKPDVLAPGVDIRSSIPGGSYAGGWNGTSMAAPHVAGLMALLWQADRSLSLAAVEYAITTTVIDLGVPGKDNNTGYGRMDAYQAVGSVIQGGTIAGRITDQVTGRPLADALVTMRHTQTRRETATRTDSAGHYALSVAEGEYYVTASKFGYEQVTSCLIQVLAQTTTQLDLALQPRPSGAIIGRVTLGASATPVSATVSLVGTPAQTLTDAEGYYTLAAPTGTYSVRALPTEVGYRGAQVSGVNVVTDSIATLNLSVSSAPRLLLVDADARMMSYAPYFQAALSAMLLSHHTHSILNPPQDNPSAAELAQYDVVIWSQPSSSPGYIGAWSELGAYLSQGGRLLITGEDIGYWDKDRQEYRDYLHARLVADDAGLDPLSGVTGELLAGLQLAYNTQDSAANQTSPDSLALGDSFARSIIGPRQDSSVGLRADACTHRTIYLGFGLEGVGPSLARQELLSRAIHWLSAPRPSRGVSLSALPSSQSAVTGAVVRYDLYVVNDGQAPDRYDLSTDSAAWPARLLDPATGETISRTPNLAPCQALALRLEVSVAISATTNQAENITVRARSVGAPEVMATRTVRAIASRPWAAVPNLPTPRYRLAAAGQDCAVYAIGGFLDDASGTATRFVDILSLRTGAWSRGTPKPTAAGNCGVAQLDGRIYLLGGYDSNTTAKFLDVVEVYDPVQNTWESTTSLPQPLSGPAAVALGGKIYMFGGNGPSGPVKTSQVFDPATGAWSPIAPLPVGELSFAGAVALDGAIYLVGGWPNLTSLLRYQPSSDSWTTLAPLRVGRQSPAIVAAAGAIYVAGGGDNWDGIGTVERYDPAANSWTEMLPLRDSKRAGAAGAYADGRFYVIGGVGDGTANWVEYLDLDAPLQGAYFTVDKPISSIGETLRYTLLVRNSASRNLSVNWSHRFPAEIAYVAGSITGGAQYDATTRSLRWTGQIPAAGAVSFSFLGSVGMGVPNETPITSTVSLDGGECAPRELQALTRVSMPSVERSGKSVDRLQVAPGGRLRYTINVANGTPYTIASVSLVDPIPPHTALIADSLTGGAYNAPLHRIEWQGSLPPAEPAGRVFSWADATSGRRLSLGDDSCTGPLPLGFAFEFYGNTYSDIYVNSNGMVLFGSCSSAFSNGLIPSTAEPNDFVAPLWDDLTPGNGAVYVATFSSAPRRYAVVEWHEVNFYGQNQPQTFEVILYEGTNSVVFQYLALNGDRARGTSATVGIENRTGTAGIQYLYDGSPAEHALRSQLVLEMPHTSTRNAATHVVAFDVNVDSPLPPLYVITNTAWISDGLFTHTRAVSTTVYAPSFAGSSKLVQPQRALAGDTLTYTLRIINSGPITATEVTLVDPLPQGLVPGSLHIETGGATYNQALNAVEWRGALPPGGDGLAITYRATLANGLPANTWITNTATISVQNVPLASLVAGVLVNEVNLEGSTKSAQATEVAAGSPVTYTIALRNSGLLAARRIIMADFLPVGLTMITDTLEGAVFVGRYQVIVWQGLLQAGGEHLVRYRAIIPQSVPNDTIVRNTVAIDNGHGQIIQRSASVRVLRADLSSSDISVYPTRLPPGGVVTYTLRLRNTGAVDTAATLHCTLPEPLAPALCGACASSGDISISGRNITWSGDIQSQGMVIVHIPVTTPPGTPIGQATLQATLVDAGGLEQRLVASVLLGSHPAFLPLTRR